MGLSNYPPGVTGNEPELTGDFPPPYEPPEGVLPPTRNPYCKGSYLINPAGQTLCEIACEPHLCGFEESDTWRISDDIVKAERMNALDQQTEVFERMQATLEAAKQNAAVWRTRSLTQGGEVERLEKENNELRKRLAAK